MRFTSVANVNQTPFEHGEVDNNSDGDLKSVRIPLSVLLPFKESKS
jgi:hypothetical protein